jgi:hypothetical protein
MASTLQVSPNFQLELGARRVSCRAPRSVGTGARAPPGAEVLARIARACHAPYERSRMRPERAARISQDRAKNCPSLSSLSTWINA